MKCSPDISQDDKAAVLSFARTIGTGFWVAGFLAAGTIAGWPTAAHADFADGVQAFDGGDYARAVAEWRPLADSGDAEAQVSLAGLYTDGLGVGQDFAKAADLYERAARQGHVAAQLNLGDFYAKGHGVKRDPMEAYFWLSLAAIQGNAWAAARRDKISGRMTRAQIGAAEARVRNWRPER